MIKRPDNWDNIPEFTAKKNLPVGGYVCRIKNAAIEPVGSGGQLKVFFDIEEGEYAGYYTKDFNASTRDDKKWKGILRVWLPKYDGSEKDEWTLSTLKGFVSSVERSNPAYRWDWNEVSLRNKLVGIIFRNEEFDYNGKNGWSTRPFRASSVDTIRSGDYDIPADKPLKRASSYDDTGSSYGSSYGSSDTTFKPLYQDDGDLPF